MGGRWRVALNAAAAALAPRRVGVGARADGWNSSSAISASASASASALAQPRRVGLRGIHGGAEGPPSRGPRVVSSRASAAVGNFTANQQRKALEGLHSPGGGGGGGEGGFDLEDLGVGGLDAEFGTPFRRVFASRLAPAEVVRDLGVRHVRGVILEGPPGTGKTLLARQMASLLKARPPKVVAGPEIFSMHVGESEEAVRALFCDAENEWKLRGEESSLAHLCVLRWLQLQRECCALPACTP